MSGMAEEFEPTTNHQIGNYAWLSSQHQPGTTSTAAKLSGFPEELPAPLYKQVAEPDGSGFSKHHIVDNNRVVHDREQRIVFVQYADGTTLRRFNEYVVVVNRNKDFMVKLSKLPWCVMD